MDEAVSQRRKSLSRLRPALIAPRPWSLLVRWRQRRELDSQYEWVMCQKLMTIQGVSIAGVAIERPMSVQGSAGLGDIL